MINATPKKAPKTRSERHQKCHFPQQKWAQDRFLALRPTSRPSRPSRLATGSLNASVRVTISLSFEPSGLNSTCDPSKRAFVPPFFPWWFSLFHSPQRTTKSHEAFAKKPKATSCTHITGGTEIPSTARVRISSLLTTATVASRNFFRPSSASVRMGCRW